jgi:hypothetical protein
MAVHARSGRVEDVGDTFVFVNGVMAAMENRPVREANGAGGWVTKFGILDRTGVGDLAAFAYHQAEQPGR